MSGRAPGRGHAMARADLWTGVALLALGLATLWGGWSMDRLEARGVHPASAPGLLPGLLGAALTVCAAFLVGGAWRRGRAGRPPGGLETAAAARLLAAASLCLAYPLALIPALPFWLATTAFVTAFVAAFEWTPRSVPSHARALAAAAALGAAVGVATAWVLGGIFLVRPP